MFGGFRKRVLDVGVGEWVFSGVAGLGGGVFGGGDDVFGLLLLLLSL